MLSYYKNGEFSHEYGLHILAESDNGEQLNYILVDEGSVLSLSNRTGWNEDDLRYADVSANKVRK